MVLPFLPLLANSFGWIFTEVGRQPWVGLRADDHRPGGLARRQRGRGLISLIVLTLLYAGLAVVEVRLMLTYIEPGADPIAAADDPDADGRRQARWPSRTDPARTPPWNSPPSGSP